MKKNKTTPHLDFYIQCCENDFDMPESGLCLCTDDHQGKISSEILDLLEPSTGEKLVLPHAGYWGGGDETIDGKHPNLGIRYTFTTLRQTIVLFMAAINNEL